MDPHKLNEMDHGISDVLEAGRRFDKVFGKSYSSGVIGELLVTKRIIEKYKQELTSSNRCNIQFKGNCIQDFDIILDINGIKFKINAKATTERDKKTGKPRWVRQHAKKYVNITYDKNNKTICSPMMDYNKALFYVFVDVKKWLEESKTDFYVLSDLDAKKTFGKKYSKDYHGKYKRKNGSDDMWIEYKDLKQYQDNNLKRFKKEIFNTTHPPHAPYRAPPDP